VHDGRIYAVDDFCPHRGASLAAGLVTPDGYVECAHHGWQYALEGGQARLVAHGGIDCFAVEDRDGEVFVGTAACAKEDPDGDP
jgi:nitrite reductase/ring-hydroxylating ferredoxin subunit